MTDQPDLFAARPEPPAEPTLADARARFFRELEEGPAVCSCCDRLASKDVRQIHSTMGLGLIVLSKLGGEERRPVHVRELVERLRRLGTTNPAADFAKLRWWGLIEDPGIPPEEGQKSAGFWVLTDRGRDFVAGAATVPAKVVRWNKETEGFEGERVSIRDVLGDRFNYDELMAWRRGLEKETDR